MYVGFSEDFCDSLAEYIPDWPFDYIHSLKSRKIKIRIDPYDTWNMDYTLALIAHPMLVQLRAEKHGSGSVDDEDVPEHLRRSSAPPMENEWDTDELFHQRFEWVMDEMIYAFSTKIDDDFEESFYDAEGKLIDRDVMNKSYERIDNGFRLFGKYYQNLWD